MIGSKHLVKRLDVDGLVVDQQQFDASINGLAYRRHRTGGVSVIHVVVGSKRHRGTVDYAKMIAKNSD